MTVPVNSRRRDHQGNGVALQFAAPMAYQKTHLAVYLIEEVDGEEVATLVSPSAYTVTRFGVVAGSVVKFTAAPTSLQKILILRVVPYAQDVDVTNLGRFLPETIERGYDLLAMQLQQLADQQSRALQGPDVHIGSDWNFDAGSRRITGVADAEDGGDVPNLAQVLALTGATPSRFARILEEAYTDSSGTVDTAPPGFIAPLVAGKVYRIKAFGHARVLSAGVYSAILRFSNTGADGTICGRGSFSTSTSLDSVNAKAIVALNGNDAQIQIAPDAPNTMCWVDIEAVLNCTATGTLALLFASTSSVLVAQLDAGFMFTVDEVPITPSGPIITP